MKKKFDEGEATGTKSDAASVAKEMIYIKEKDGKRLFQKSEFLTPQQVTSYFSRLASEARGIGGDVEEEEKAVNAEKRSPKSEVFAALNPKH